MKIKLKHAKESSTHLAHSEVKPTVTSIFVIAKELQVDLATVVHGLKTA